jgi:GNAT superfamily N-acetyltransferase
MEFTIREGRKEDIPGTLRLIQELAEFEKAPEQVHVTEEQLENDGFGENPLYGLFVAEDAGNLLGIALYYYRYSTWKGKTLFLEDIVVQQNMRGLGIGQELFNQVIRKASEEKCYRMSWQVLDWNEQAITFYEKYGATLDGGWLNCDFFAEDLERLTHEIDRI